jgi:hypothetical protein
MSVPVPVSITRDARGRHVVTGARQYGAYRSRAMADYRAAQVTVSQFPPRVAREGKLCESK